MITLKEIEMVTMNDEKRNSSKNDYFAFYIGRPISYLVTIPFLYTNITPNMVSIISIIPLVLGFVMMSFGDNQFILLLGWFCFFLWNILDGVDGNIARYRKQFSQLGSVYDAMSGYIAMVFSFFAWGIAASNSFGILNSVTAVSNDLYIILGALSGLFVIFPRLVMHKMITTLENPKSASCVKNKAEYNFIKLIALNLTSVSGFVQVLMLLAILFKMIDIFTIVYFILNFIVMVTSLITMFKSNTKATYGGVSE